MNKILFCLWLLLFASTCLAELPKQEQSFSTEITKLEEARTKAFKDREYELLYLIEGKIQRRRDWQRFQRKGHPLTEWKTAFYLDLHKENKEALKHYKKHKDEEARKVAEKNIEEIEQMGIANLRESMIIRVSGDDGSSSSSSSKRSRYGRRSSSYSNYNSRHQDLLRKFNRFRR